jgi:5-methylcytosine-specific restriction endonuclease McrA
MKKTDVETFTINSLRRAFRRWPACYQTLEEAKEEYYIVSKNGKRLRRVRYTCAQCGKKFSRKQCEVDHIEPIANLDGYTTLDEYAKRLFCKKDNLQVLCKKVCHKKKSSEEAKIRKNSSKKS